MLGYLRSLADDGRVVLVPERDEHVDFVLRNWDEVTALADVPLPPDPETVLRLRRKDQLPLAAAEAGVPSPATFFPESEESVHAAELQPPFLLKPAEGQEYALRFGEKAVVANDADEAAAVWRQARDAGFEMILQELVPDSHEHVYSLFAYVGRAGEPLATVVGRKVRQGPLRFGTSAVFEVRFEPEVLELGLRLLDSVGYRGFAHVEFARDLRDETFKVLEVNTRVPVWAGVAMTEAFDVARVAYDDLCGVPTPARATFQGRPGLGLPGEGPLGLRADGAAPRALAPRLPRAARADREGARGVRPRRPAARARQRGLPPVEALGNEDRARRPARLHDALRRPARIGSRGTRARGASPDLAVPPRPDSQPQRLRPRRALHPLVEPAPAAQAARPAPAGREGGRVSAERSPPPAPDRRTRAGRRARPVALAARARRALAAPDREPLSARLHRPQRHAAPASARTAPGARHSHWRLASSCTRGRRSSA